MRHLPQESKQVRAEQEYTRISYSGYTTNWEESFVPASGKHVRMNPEQRRDVVQFRVCFDEVAEHEPALRGFKVSLVFGGKWFHLVTSAGRQSRKAALTAGMSIWARGAPSMNRRRRPMGDSLRWGGIPLSVPVFQAAGSVCRNRQSTSDWFGRGYRPFASLP